jgi:hypothetical protein
MGIICIDADDFHEGNHKLPVLEKLHANTGMLFTLFVIPGLCSSSFISEVKKIPWIDLVPHGWLHPTSRECEKWTYLKSKTYLECMDFMGLTKGFRAPGWQISSGMYQALLEHGYWVSDQHYNDDRRPPLLKVFHHRDEHHFHIGHTGGFNQNEIEIHLERLMDLKGDFRFIKDIV